MVVLVQEQVEQLRAALQLERRLRAATQRRLEIFA